MTNVGSEHPQETPHKRQNSEGTRRMMGHHNLRNDDGGNIRTKPIRCTKTLILVSVSFHLCNKRSAV